MEFRPVPLLPHPVLCNCYAYVKNTFPSIPGTADIKRNLQRDVADIVVFNYAGLDHYALVEREGTSTIDISETNYGACRKGSRTINKDDPSIIGYYAIIK